MLKVVYTVELFYVNDAFYYTTLILKIHWTNYINNKPNALQSLNYVKWLNDYIWGWKPNYCCN